jgi:hypothetical protein
MDTFIAYFIENPSLVSDEELYKVYLTEPFNLLEKIEKFEFNSSGYIAALMNNKFDFINMCIDNNFIDRSKMNTNDIAASIIYRKHVKLPSVIPVNWYPFYFQLRSFDSINIQKKGKRIFVDNLFEFIDTNENIRSVTYNKYVCFYISNVITPIVNKPLFTRTIKSFNTLKYLKRLSMCVSIENIDNYLAVMSQYVNHHNIHEHPISKCLDFFQDEILNVADDDNIIRTSMGKVVDYYTGYETYHRVRHFLNGKIEESSPEYMTIKEIVSILNNIIWDLSSQYLLKNVSYCSNLVLYRGLGMYVNVPIFTGSIINSTRYKFQSFSYSLDIAIGFSKGGIILALFCNMNTNVMLPIGDLKIGDNYLSNTKDREYEFLLPIDTNLRVIDYPKFYKNRIIVPVVIHSQTQHTSYRKLPTEYLVDIYTVP